MVLAQLAENKGEPAITRCRPSTAMREMSNDRLKPTINAPARTDSQNTRLDEISSRQN